MKLEEEFKDRFKEVMKQEGIDYKLKLINTSDGICLGKKKEIFVGIKKPNFAFSLFLHELTHAIQFEKYGDTGHDADFANTLTRLNSKYCIGKQRVRDEIYGFMQYHDQYGDCKGKKCKICKIYKALLKELRLEE